MLKDIKIFMFLKLVNHWILENSVAFKYFLSQQVGWDKFYMKKGFKMCFKIFSRELYWL